MVYFGVFRAAATVILSVAGAANSATQLRQRLWDGASVTVV